MQQQQHNTHGIMRIQRKPHDRANIKTNKDTSIIKKYSARSLWASKNLSRKYGIQDKYTKRPTSEVDESQNQSITLQKEPT